MRIKDDYQGIKKSYLKKLPFFSNLKDTEIEKLITHTYTKKFPKNRLIIRQNDPGDSLYVILKGKVNVILEGKEKEPFVLASLKKGDFFGEMSLFNGKPRSASVVTDNDTNVLILGRKDFLNLLKKHPEIAINILTELTKRLRETDKQIGNLSTLDLYGRVARALINISSKKGKSLKDGILIKTSSINNDISKFTGIPSKSISLIINQLETKGMIKKISKGILVPHGVSFFS